MTPSRSWAGGVGAGVAVGAGAGAARPWSSSSGSGKTIVEPGLLLISVSAWSVRNCSVTGLGSITAAASASFAAAWNSPSALITFARRLRSASACRASACCIRSGISTSLISTIVTFTPHGSVCSSMICWRFSLSRSRSDSSVSSSALPSTERNVVCATCEVAATTSSTSTTERTGSITRK